MEITDEYCNEIVEMFKSDHEDFTNRMEFVLNDFKNKYQNKENYNEESFRKDTKQVYRLLLNTFASEETKKEIETEFTDNKNSSNEDLNDKLTYMQFTCDIKYVYDNIDTVNLQDPDSNFKEICNNVMGYLKKGSDDLNELSNSMKELTNKLKDLTNLLELKNKE